MELRPGYKKTDVGVIPADWVVRSLESLADKIMVGIASAATHAYRAKGIPLFRNQNIRSGCLDDSDLLFVSPEYEVVFKNKRLRSGDLLTARTGYPGTTCEVPPQYDSAQSFTTLITRPRKSEIDSSFLCHYINSEQGQRFFEQGQIGGAQKNVNAGTLRQMPIPTPLRPEQRAIATALSDVDALLAGLGSLIAKKRDLKQATMQQLLTGKTRLPGFQGEWEVKPLGEIGEISGSGVDKKSLPDEVPVRLLNYMDVYRGSFIYSSLLHHTVTAQPNHARRCSVLKGDVFFTPSSETRDDIAHSAVAMEDIADAAYSYHIVRLRLREPWDLRFRAYAFKTAAFYRQAETVCDGGGTRYVISLDKFRGLIVGVPPVAEQAAIAEILWEMDAELTALEARRDKTGALRQGMMQELLTGRTRLV
jgi:type I restriction enzyme S subunit